MVVYTTSSIHLSYSLGEAPPKFNSSFSWWAIWLVHPQNKKKTHWRLPKIEGSIVKYKVLPLWPIYIGERRTTSAKACGIKWGTIGNFLGNMLGTWELFASPHPAPNPKNNLHGKSNVHCPNGKWTVDNPLSTTNKTWKKKPPPPPTHKKKRNAPSLHDSTSHWLDGNSIPKIGCHYFWPGLIPSSS